MFVFYIWNCYIVDKICFSVSGGHEQATKIVSLIRFQRWLPFLFVGVYVVKNSSWFDFYKKWEFSSMTQKFCIFAILILLLCIIFVLLWYAVGSDLLWFTFLKLLVICYSSMLVMIWLWPFVFFSSYNCFYTWMQ